MGNSVSRELLSKDVDYKSYVQQEWRSQRSSELDLLGGLGRPALALGQSFNAKMHYLGEVLVEQGEKMQEILTPPKDIILPPQAKPAPSKHLHTDRRAAARRGALTLDPPELPQGPNMSPPRRFLSQAEYQKVRKAAKEAAGHRQQARASKQTVPPAEWRKRMHAARRNVMLMVRTMVLLKRGHKHPKRLLRFSNLDFIIPQVLAEDCGRFAAEQQVCADIRRSIGAARAELDELLRAEAATVQDTDASDQLATLPSAFGSPAGKRPSYNGQQNAGTQRHVTYDAESGVALRQHSDQERSSAPEHRRLRPALKHAGTPSALQARQERLGTEGLCDIQEESSTRFVASGSAGGSSDGSPGKLPLVSKGSQQQASAKRFSNEGSQAALDMNARALLSPVRKPNGLPLYPRNSSLQSRNAINSVNSAGNEIEDAPRPSWNSSNKPLVNRQLSMPVSMRDPNSTAPSKLKDGADKKANNTQAGQSEKQKNAEAVALRQTRMAVLRDRLDSLYDQLKKSTKLLGMYVNRVNGAWAEAQQWSAPAVTGAQELTSWLTSAEYTVYKADVLRQLRQGQIAVQLMVCDDAFALPEWAQGRKQGKDAKSGVRQLQQDLWTSDLWELVETVRPGILPPTARIEGLSYCGRVLCELSLAVQELAGKAAVEKLHVILHINEEQQQDLVDELHMHECYGLTKENVILLVANRHPGYCWDAAEGCFNSESSLAATWGAGACLAATASGQHPNLNTLGSGAAVCQLAWAGEAFTVGNDGQPVPLDQPVLERLEARKIDWMVSRRSRDLALLQRNGILDISNLAYTMHLRDKLRANCVLEVVRAESAVTARLHDSVVLHPACKAKHDTKSVVELRQSDIVSSSVIQAVEAMRTAPGSKGLALGISRYLLHVPTVQAQLTSLSSFRPRLSLDRHLLNVGLDMADLFVHDKGKAVAVEARLPAEVLSTPTSLELLLPLLQRQDHDPAFRDLILAHLPQASPAEMPSVVAAKVDPHKPGHPIIVFLSNNQVAATAVKAAANLARAGRDCIQLVHIVPTSVQIQSGEELLANYKRQAMRSMVEVTTHVIVRKSAGLLECMERFVSDSTEEAGARPLVVMGSIQLTSHVFTYMASSVALSAAKRLAGTPVLMLTLNSKQVPNKPGMKCMALVEAHSKNMVKWACTDLLEAGRGDKLMFSQVAPSVLITRQQAAAMRRLLENFHTLAHGHQTPVHKAVYGEGPMESVLCEQVEEHGVSMLALQLPAGTKTIPQHLLTLMRSCKGGTLLYQEAGMRQSALRKSMSLRRSVGLLANTMVQARRAVGDAIEKQQRQL